MALSIDSPFSSVGRDLWPGYSEESLPGPTQRLAKAPNDVRTSVHSVLNEVGNQFGSSLIRSLSNYFGREQLSHLITVQSNAPLSTVELNGSQDEHDRLRLRLDIHKDGSAVTVEFDWPEENAIDIPRDVDRLGFVNGSLVHRTMAVRSLVSRILLENGLPVFGALYLPAGRSGLISGAQAIATAALSLIDRTQPLSSAELGPFTGVERGFVRTLIDRVPAETNLLLRPGWNFDLAMALLLLETELMKGTVHVRRSGVGGPTFVFQEGGLTLSMQQSSSMVAEWSSLALWLKALLASGALLIIDEPEAHLHPENQRLMARLLVRLVNAGVRVIATTHSSLILHQISNSMMASQLGDSPLSTTGLLRVDAISPDKVAAYLFEKSDTGTVVSPLEVDPDFGIAEDEFLRVAEAIGEETYNLSIARNEERLVGA
ncbi:MAG TPA: AAA family ATPase [Thermomicrobiales bacterium]